MAKNLLHDHPSPEVRAAMVALCDALTMWERSTGRNYLIIVKSDAPGAIYEWRSLSGGPAPPVQSDAMLLVAFEGIAEGNKGR
jgi:hypothetical protein